MFNNIKNKRLAIYHQIYYESIQLQILSSNMNPVIIKPAVTISLGIPPSRVLTLF
jgi:hypothetical protein